MENLGLLTINEMAEKLKVPLSWPYSRTRTGKYVVSLRIEALRRETRQGNPDDNLPRFFHCDFNPASMFVNDDPGQGQIGCIIDHP